MNQKRFLTLCVVVIFSLIWAAPAAWAGSAQRHRLEGAIIGIGALMLTKAIIDHSHDVYVAPSPRPVVRPYGQPESGCWQIQRQWVPARHKKVWHPGHYNRSGRWVPGSWMQIEIESGYWTERRVWVPYN